MVEVVRRKRERGLAMRDILAVSAAPGYSEHHSGRAVDLTSAGYAALGTTLAGMRVPTVLVQEGGYVIDTLGDLVLAVLRGFEEG